MIQYYVDIFVLDLLILCLKIKDYTNIFSPNNFKKNDHKKLSLPRDQSKKIL